MDTTRVVFDCPIHPALVAGAAAVLLAVVLVHVWRDGRQVESRWRKALLVGGAALAGVMVVLLALSPRMVRTWPDPEPPRCLLLVDGSRSMLLTDVYDADVQRWLLERGASAPFAREGILKILLGAAAPEVAADGGDGRAPCLLDRAGSTSAGIPARLLVGR